MAYTMAQAAVEFYGGGSRAEFARRKRGKKRGSRLLGRTRAGRIARGLGAAGVLGGGLALALRRRGARGGGNVPLPGMGSPANRGLPGGYVGQKALPGSTSVVNGELIDVMPVRQGRSGAGRSGAALRGGRSGGGSMVLQRRQRRGQNFVMYR